MRDTVALAHGVLLHCLVAEENAWAYNFEACFAYLGATFDMIRRWNTFVDWCSINEEAVE